MKKTNLLLFTLFITILVTINFISCDDAGVPFARNEITFQPTNLKRLDPGQGYYEIFVCFDNVDSNSYSLGKFNMSNDGLQTLDSLGSPVALKLRRKPYKLEYATKIILTIEPSGDYDTLPGIRLMGGLVTNTEALIIANMNMSFPEAFGDLTNTFINSFASAMLNTPTTDSTNDYFKGVWFCDTIQQALLNLPVLPDSLNWQYEGWIYDGTQTAFYSTGKFVDCNHKDLDGAGSYSGTGSYYDKPGQDFIWGPNSAIDLRGGPIKFFVSLEPKNENALGKTVPTGLNIFNIAPIGLLPLGQVFAVPNVATTLPSAIIQITKE